MAPTTRSSKRRATEGPLETPEPSQSATVPEKDAYAESSNGRVDTPDSEVDSDPQPVRKRARRAPKAKGDSVPTKAPKKGKVKGKLEMFKNVPVEVFIEIAKYLHPFDLVLLSRVNKFFRELFMTRQAASIWVSARQNVPGLPPCPPELCEPQYAALLFTKMCSQCGKYAPRHMDPALLVRLCTKCREEQYKMIPLLLSKITDSTLVAYSSEPPPRHFRYCRRLYLSSDVEAVESKLMELKSAGDKDALILWQNERRKTLGDRYENAKLFTSWFTIRDLERGDDLNRRKDTHEAEVTTRLISLGWEQADHMPHYNPRRKQWISLVRAAKVLTDRGWEKLLPQLQTHLEANRRERLERERNDRRRARGQELYDLWLRVKKQSEPLLQAIPQQDDPEAASLPGATPQQNILHQSFPAYGKMREWSEYQPLLDEDISGDELKVKLEEKLDSFHEYIQKWRTQLEEALIQQLPDHTELPNFDAPGLTLVSNGQPANNIFSGIQMLLRADVAFKREFYSCTFYPEDFQETSIDLSQVHYDAESSTVATNLLRALGRPGATYLEMRSLGSVFQCGRCNGPGERMTWKGIVRHFATRKSDWERLSKLPCVLSAKDFVFICTHDLQVENTDKPPVLIVNSGDPMPPMYGPKKLCLVCQGAGMYNLVLDPYIDGHLRDVHLIEEPEQGKHFRAA